VSLLRNVANHVVGCCVATERRSRFQQIIGDSHKLEPDQMEAQYGRFDLIFIDGDHSRKGVHLDTGLALQLLNDGGTICWHDANPKPKYLAVREYLEQELPMTALATADTYLGGVACWNRMISQSLTASKLTEALV
jgi:predicted O-methyltransferase YrrM